MLIIPEQKITYISCNVPELDYDIYNPTQVYNLGDKVSVAADGKNYYATKTIAAGVQPIPTDIKGTITGWFPETSNRNKQLENTVFNQTTNPDSIGFLFRAINIDTLSFFNVDAREIYIKMSDYTTRTVVYEKTINLVYNEISLYNYFFVPTWLKDKLTLKLQGTEYENKIAEIIDALTPAETATRYTINPPLMFNALVEVSIKKTGDIAKCGKVFVGQSIDLGFSLWAGTEIRTRKYGIVKQDEYWGNYTIEKGNIVNMLTIPVQIDTKKLDYAISILNRYAYDFCLFIGDEGQRIRNLTAYGLAEDTSFSPGITSTAYTLKIGSTI